MQLPADQQLQQESVLAQQQTTILSPQEWLAQQPKQEQLSTDMQTPQVYTPSTAPAMDGILSPAEWLAQQPKPSTETPFKLEDTANMLYKAGSALTEPATAALETISYLDKPRGAIAGGIKAMQDNTPLWEGIKKGANENTSYKETFNPEWVKENPKTAAFAGLAADIAFDPLWLITPAKIAGGIAKGSKAVGLTDKVINPAVNSFKGTDAGKSAIALADDIAGKNRTVDNAYEFGSARATDNLNSEPLMAEVNKLKETYGNDLGLGANKLTNYIEAAPKPTSELLTRPQEIADVVDMARTGKLTKALDDGVITKHQAFNALRDAGEEIPNTLLQNHQRVANELAYGPGKIIPDTITRDQVLSSISDPGLRGAIETIGEQFIAKNKANADKLRASGRLSQDAYVSFMDGEHLRRSFAKYESPEKFLENLRKNGTTEEYRQAYQDLTRSNAPGSQGHGANHKVDTADFIQRQTLSDDTLNKLGIIKDPEYRILDTLNRASKTLREDEYLADINSLWGKTGDEAADLSRTLPTRRQYVPIPDTEAYGALKGKWVPKDIANQVIKLTGTGASSSELVQSWQKGVSWWKVAKLASPASTARNFFSGIPMANVFGDLPMQQMPKYMAKASQAMYNKNAGSALMREINSTGILGNSWRKQDLKNIIGDNPTGVKKVAERGMEWFGKPDDFWTTAIYAYHRDQGKTIKEAAQIAKKATFDYANAPEWVGTLGRNGIIPFATFPFFAGKATAKAAWNNPAQVTKYTKAQNQVNNDDREKIMPDYMKSRTLLPLGDGTRMVNGKEQKVSNNLDLSYILPFSNDVKLGNPITDMMALAATGKNGLGQQVIKPGMLDDEKAKVWKDTIVNSFAPSFPLPGNYAGDKLKDAWNGTTDKKGRQYDLPSAVAQVLFGLKNVPINEQEMFNQKVTGLLSEQRSVMAIRNDIIRDKSMPKEQRDKKIADHNSQLKEIDKKLKEVGQAWQREKKRGVN